MGWGGGGGGSVISIVKCTTTMGENMGKGYVSIFQGVAYNAQCHKKGVKYINILKLQLSINHNDYVESAYMCRHQRQKISETEPQMMLEAQQCLILPLPKPLLMYPVCDA